MNDCKNCQSTIVKAAPKMYQALVEIKDFLEHMHEMPVDWTITESTVKHNLISNLLSEVEGNKRNEDI